MYEMSWPFSEKVEQLEQFYLCDVREKTNKMQQSGVYYQQQSNSNLHSAHTLQHSTPHAVTHGLCSPEDGHTDAWNMLRQHW